MYASQHNRTLSALGAAAIVGGLAAALVLGLRADEIARAAEALIAVNLPAPRPSPSPTPTPPPKAAKAAPKGDPGTRNLRNKATQRGGLKNPDSALSGRSA